MLVGGATIGTTIAYIGARMVIQHPPRPESGYHDGADLAATAAALFRFLHDLL
jgi:hypothetical protein